MSETTIKNIYCFDTSAIIECWKRHYRPDTFKHFWELIESGIKGGTILIPDEVRNEIGTGKDDISTWFKKFKSYITPITTEQLEIVSGIVNKYPGVSQYKKTKPFHADPFVVAVGKTRSCTVVTYEGKNGSPTNPSVPSLCAEFGVSCCDMSELFAKENWQFSIN